MTMTNDQLQKYLLAVAEGKIQACGNAGVITDKIARPCSPRLQWLDHLGATCSTAWCAQCADGPEFNPSRGLVRRVCLRKSNYVKTIPMHMMIREIIPNRQQRIRQCPL